METTMIAPCFPALWLHVPILHVPILFEGACTLLIQSSGESADNPCNMRPLSSEQLGLGVGERFLVLEGVQYHC